MHKLVTVYIPTKNRLALLQNAIDSVLGQTYENWELIIVNDASTDETKEYLDKITATNPKIKAVHHEKSQGACVSRNDAIFRAKGNFITGLDDDDVFKNDRLQKFIDNWEDKYIALFASKDVIKNNVYITNKILDHYVVNQKDLLYGNVMGNQIFTKIENLKKINGFDPAFKIWQDYDCWYRLLAYGQAKYIPYTTYVFDESDREDRITKASREKILSTYKQFIKKHNLKFKDQIILRFNLIYYRIESYGIFFYIKMLVLTGFDLKTFKTLNKNYLLPLIKVVFKKIGFNRK